MKKINTVTGEVSPQLLGKTLTHEHIWCLYKPMADVLGRKWFDRERIVNLSVKYLKHMKEKYGLNTLVDATVFNLGRDMDILREVSEKAEVYITASTGLYWNYEPMVDRKSENCLAEMFLYDCTEGTNGIKPALLKCAAEQKETFEYCQKLIRALSKVQKETGLPLYVHTKSSERLGLAVAESAESAGVDMKNLIIGHCSDTDDVNYLLDIAKHGCYIALDRLNDNDVYLKRNTGFVKTLCANGYADRILLSHDALIYSDFSQEGHEYQPDDPETSRFTVLFRKFIPMLKEDGILDDLINKIICDNPRTMLSGAN